MSQFLGELIFCVSNAKRSLFHKFDTVQNWSCRHNPAVEYVLDYLIERKSTHDLAQSIKGGRYEQQKYWMRRTGLRHLYYLLEGNPDAMECE